jgi:hypothetical protein
MPPTPADARRSCAVSQGYLDPTRLFRPERLRLVREVAPARCGEIDGYQDLGAEIRAHPFYEPKDLAAHVRRVVDDPTFRRTFEV